MKRFRSLAPTVLLVGVLLVGVGLLIYPTFSDWWNRIHQSRAIDSYIESVEELDDAEYEALLESAREYNDWLYRTNHRLGLSDAELAEYEEELRLSTTDVMGYIEIEKIDVYLPIYHTTSDAVLQAGIGHLEGTSLPVGGENTHCVLSGHRGLPSAELFSELDLLEIGDTFVLHVLGETLTYEVDQILTVLPTEVDALAIEEGQDYVTLLTCTPYGVNTHRLLVRGHRVANAVLDRELAVPTLEEDEDAQRLLLLSLAAAALGFVTALSCAVCLIRWRHHPPSGKNTTARRGRKGRDDENRQLWINSIDQSAPEDRVDAQDAEEFLDYLEFWDEDGD